MLSEMEKDEGVESWQCDIVDFEAGATLTPEMEEYRNDHKCLRPSDRFILSSCTRL